MVNDGAINITFNLWFIIVNKIEGKYAKVNINWA